MRFLADMPEEDVRWLDRIAQETGRSRAAILRDAVSSYRADAGEDWIDRAFGLWCSAGCGAEDGLQFQRQRRAL